MTNRDDGLIAPYPNTLELTGGTMTGPLGLATATTPAASPGAAVVYSVNGTPWTVEPVGTRRSMISPSVEQSAGPAGAVCETVHRYTIVGTATPTSGALVVMAVSLAAGQSISQIGFCTSSQAAVNPTHWWAALLDNTFTLQAHTADQLTTAMPASTWQLLPVVTPYVATYTGAFYLGLMVATSTTQPTILAPSFSPVIQLITGANNPGPIPGGVSSTGLTTPGTDGTTVYATPTTVSPALYMYATA